MLLGCGLNNIDGGNANLYNFIRAETDPAPLLYANNTADIIRNGQIFTNGVAVSGTMVPLADVFTLMEFHPAGCAHVSMLGIDREVFRLNGGMRVAEIVLYERELTDREKLATRNYLMKKWFGKEPAALPEAEAPSSRLIEITALSGRVRSRRRVPVRWRLTT